MRYAHGRRRAIAEVIERSVGDKREGVTQYSEGRNEPSWEPVRREARDEAQ